MVQAGTGEFVEGGRVVDGTAEQPDRGEQQIRLPFGRGNGVEQGEDVRVGGNGAAEAFIGE